MAHFTHNYDWWQALELAIESEGWKVSDCCCRHRTVAASVGISAISLLNAWRMPNACVFVCSQIVLLLRLTPLVPFNLLNYALGCTVVSQTRAKSVLGAA